jgi:DNA-binding response OmpR family regulator
MDFPELFMRYANTIQDIAAAWKHLAGNQKGLELGHKMAGETILIVDDEEEISDLIALYLKRNGYQPKTCASGNSALEIVSTEKPDLIILDIQLPDIDGLELCQHIRRMTDCPILFLSCMGTDADKILGLAVCGDDYMTKPFSPGELVARVEAHLRRNRVISSKTASTEQVIKISGLTIDLASHTLYINEKPVALPLKEFKILALLAQNPNMVFSLAHIYDLIWGADNIGDTRTVMVHISNLRKKIELDPSNPKLIVTIKGAGYKLNAPL